MTGDAVGPLTIIAVLAVIAIATVAANTAMSAVADGFKKLTGEDIFLPYRDLWGEVSKVGWLIIAATFSAAAFTVWRVIRER
jgi:roadblock/LC7 domain-containing protein